MSTANFKRPIVILGPLNDIAMEKLTREMPDEYEVAGKLSFILFDHNYQHYQNEINLFLFSMMNLQYSCITFIFLFYSALFPFLVL